MYISRIPLNWGRYEARQIIASPYRIHAAVEQSFPPQTRDESTDGRVLWRLDVNNKDARTVWLYVVSPAKPDFTHIVEQAGWPLYNEWETKDYDLLLNRLRKAQYWRFRLRANPVRKAKVDQGKRHHDGIVGKLQGHVTVSQQTAWLTDRAQSHGFHVVEKDDVPDVVVSQRQRQQFLRQGKTVTLSTALFDGVLEITDVEQFRTALCNGIGRAKGFGCGLLTIAPYNSNSQSDGGE